MKEATSQDEIIAEVRTIREELAAQFGYDVDRLYEEMSRREQAANRKVIESTPKRVQKAA